MDTDGIYLHDVSFAYSGSDKNSISHLTLHVEKGIFLGITGSNGSGKTTLSYLFNGLIPHEIDGRLMGEITVDGIETKNKPVSFFSKKVGMVFQNPDHMIFNLTVYEEVEFGLKNLGYTDIQKRVVDALSLVHLEKFSSNDPNNLSFGQKQKLCVACALALDTEYLVLDEPSSMLDYKSSLELYKLLSELNKKGKTIIVIEHDTDFINTFADHALVLREGSLDLFGITQEVFSEKEKIKSMGIKIPTKLEC